MREGASPRAGRLHDLLVVPGAEITQNHLRSRKNSHIVALNIREFISVTSLKHYPYRNGSWAT